MVKAGSYADVMFIVLRGMAITILFASFACSRSNSDVDFTPFEKKHPNPIGKGNAGLFADSFDTKMSLLLNGHDDKNYATLPQDLEEDDDNIDSGIEALVPPTSDGSTELESVDYNLIKQLTGCTSPRISLGNPVLTDGAHWKVFAKCVLHTIPKGPTNYGSIPKLAKYSSAFALAWRMNRWGLVRNKVWKLNDSAKLNYLERLVMATRLRMLTVGEKEAAAQAISQQGVVYVSYVYLIKWYLSPFYGKHFSYDKAPSPAYTNYLVSGKFVDAANLSLSDVHFEMPIESFAGYFLEGTTLSDGLFRVQHFQPVIPKMRKLPPPPTARPFLLRATKSEKAQIYVRTLTTPTTANLQLVFTGILPEPSSEDLWPNTLSARNALTDALDFSSLGANTTPCTRPALHQDKGVVVPEEWVLYLDCQFGLQRTNYNAFASREDAARHVQSIFNEYLTSTGAILKSDAENLMLLFTALTFRAPTTFESGNLSSGLQNSSLSSMVDALITSWLRSPGYERFNFALLPMLSKRKVRFAGFISDENSMPVSGVAINVLNFGTLIGSGSTMNGAYNFWALINDPIVGDTKYQLAALSLLNANKTVSLSITTSTTEIIQSFILPTLGVVTPSNGGEVHQPDGSVAINFPPGVIGGTSPIQFTISALQN